MIALQTTERDPLLREAGAQWIVKDLASVRVGEAPASDNVLLIAQTIN